jgi:hypothetical protein
MRRRRRRPNPYWIASCPAHEDQGVVCAWITGRGRPVLSCDVCHTTWFDAELSMDRAVDVDDGTGLLEDGDSLGPDARPATREELERLGWWDLVTPLSRETSDG